MKNTNDIKKERTERIKAIRMLLGMTQKQFAEGLGISREGYQKLERGENNISMDVLENMRYAYGISADYLLYGEFQDEKTMWNMIQNSSETVKLEVMIRLIEYFTASRKSLFTKTEFSLGTFLRELGSFDDSR